MLTKKFSQSSGSTNVVSVMCTKQRPWSDFKLEASVPHTHIHKEMKSRKKHSRTIVHVCWSYKMWFVTFVASLAQNKLYFKWHLELGGGEGQFLCRQLAAQLRRSPPPPLDRASPHETLQPAKYHQCEPAPAPFADFWPSLPSNKITLLLQPVLIHLRPEFPIPFSWIWILLVPIEHPKEKYQQKPSAHLRWKQFPPAKSTAEC